jgi:hypothetical protein
MFLVKVVNIEIRTLGTILAPGASLNADLAESTPPET